MIQNFEYMTQRIIVFLTVCILCLNLSAQECNTIYFMDRVPQSNQLNPAFQPKCDFFLGLPNIDYNIRNSFSLNDLLTYDSQIDSLITPIHPHGNVNQYLQKLSSKNSLYNSLQVQGLSLGFRIKDLYFTLGLSAKLYGNMYYPPDLVKLILTQRFDTTTAYNFKNLGIDATAYGELALGVSKNYNDEFTLGIRTKLLSGIFNMTTQNNKFDIYNTVDNDLYKLHINTDLNIMASGAYFKIDTNAKGQITKISSANNIADSYKPFRSMGFAIDLGGSYTAIDKFIFSASILDLGFIKWQNDEYNFKMKGDTSFAGISNIDLLHNDSNVLNKFVDSLKNTFKFSHTKTSYTTWLPTKVYLGVEFLPASFFSLGFLSLSEYYRQQFYQQLMLSANLRLFRMFMLSTSYSIFDNGFSNMGVGLSFRLSPPFVYFIPLNMYFIFDNIPLKFANKDLPLPYKLNTFNFRFGMNIVFGCNQKRKLRDKPLIFE